jgi:hypothetical protein
MWIRLNDQDAESEPIRRAFAARPSPLALHHRALLYAGSQLTDGRLDRLLVEQWLPKAAERCRYIGVLIEHGFWRELADGSGWEICGFLKANPPREQVVKDRDAAAKRKAMQRNPRLLDAVRRRDGDYCRYCGDPVSWTDRRGSRGATYDLVFPYAANTVENVVVACRRCSSEKASLTPEQAGMSLLPAPVQLAFAAPVSPEHGDRNGIKKGLGPAKSVLAPRPDPTRPDPKGVV